MSVADNNKSQYTLMTETPVNRLVLSLALPTIISMLVTAVYNMADTFFVSQLSTDASAAVGVVFSIQSLMQSAGFGIGVGAGSLISRNLGEKNKDAASKYAMSAILFGFVVGVIFFLLAVFDINGLMRLFGSNDDVLPYARDYGRFILMGAPVMCISFVLNNILRAEGKARFAMVGLSLGSVLNILLDPLFIFGWGLNLGTKGAALATLFSQIISFSILMSFFLRKKTEVEFNVKYISKDLRDYGRIIATGAPTVCRQGLAAVATTLLNRQAVAFSTAALAAVTIANKLYMFVRNIIIGLGQGFQPVAGYNYGAKKIDRVKESFIFSVKVGSVIVVTATVFFFMCDKLLMTWFRADDAEVIRIGARALRFYCMSLPLMAYSTYTNQLLQCLGKVKRATFLAACRNGIMFIPSLYILIALFGLDGILLTQPVADVLTFVISIPFQVLFFRELNAQGLGISD